MGRFVRAQSDLLGEYAAYVPAPIAGWDPLPAQALAEQMWAAEREVEQVPATSNFPMWVLLKVEGLTTSAIENVHSNLARSAEIDALNAVGLPAPEGDARSAHNATRQIKQAIELGAGGTDIDVATICDLHRTLMANVDASWVGTIRRTQNWVGGNHPSEARLVCPPPDAVGGLLADLVAYLNSDRSSPLMQAAVAHAQFETIHPFADGNGRTGRALICWVLARRNRLRGMAFPISVALLKSRGSYYESLSAYQAYVGEAHDTRRTECVVPWLDLVTRSVSAACEFGHRASEAIDEIRNSWVERMKSVRSDATAQRVLELLPEMGMFTIIEAADRLGVSRGPVRRATATLVEAGILRRERRTSRGQIFAVPEILDLPERLGVVTD